MHDKSRAQLLRLDIILREVRLMAKSLDQGVVNSFLRGLKYPIKKDDLVDFARINRVPDDLVRALQDLPAKEYTSRQEVMSLLERIGHNIT